MGEWDSPEGIDKGKRPYIDVLRPVDEVEGGI
jgi:hypothetical protein